MNHCRETREARRARRRVGPEAWRRIGRAGSALALGAVLCLLATTGRQPVGRGARPSALRGFMADASGELPYAANRVLIQVRSEAASPMLADLPADKDGRPPAVKTGVGSIDALADAAGVTAISRPYGVLRTAAKAAASGADRWLMLRFSDVADLPGLAAEFADLQEVQAVSLDWRAWPTVAPADPGLAANWGHANTGQLPAFGWLTTNDHTGAGAGTPGFDADVDEAWRLPQGLGDPEVVIAVIDTGADLAHADLRLVAGHDFGDGDGEPDDDAGDAGHGTCCAGVAAARADGSGAVGVAPGCSVMPLKVADRRGLIFFSAVQSALYHAADHGADVISMSFGAPIATDAATEAALRYAYEAGAVLVAAAGNTNRSEIDYPAASPYVIAVGAASPGGERKRSSSDPGELNAGVKPDPYGFTCDGERWWGSSYGLAVQDAAGAVDLLGPTILPTTDITGAGGYRSGDVEPFFNGTSCAAPYVAGVAALVLSAAPGLQPDEVRAALTASARDVVSVESGEGWDRYAGYGLVNARAAVLAATGGQAQVVTVTPSRQALAQNHPNPFNPVTSIAFELAQPGQVRLSVYDVRGRLVARLADGQLPAGAHAVTWDAAGRPSGVYYYRLQAPGMDESRKMTLLK
jgi:subtilisin family serine protease